MTLIGSGTITRKLVGSASLGTLAPTTTGGIEIDLIEGGDSASVFGGESPATVQITVRKDTSANWSSNNPILAAGEIGYIIEDKQFFVGDGTTAYTDLTDSNYIVHWDDFAGALNNFDSRFTSIESDVSALQSKTDGQDTFMSGLQQGLNDVVDTLSTQQSDITQLGSDISALQSDLTSNVSALQSQIDTLSGAAMKRLTIQFNASDVPSIEGAPFDIITPTSGKTLQIISACIRTEALSPSGQEVTFTFVGGVINSAIIGDDANMTMNIGILKDSYFFGINQPLQLLLTSVGSDPSDAQYTLTIFYMEV